MKIALWIGATLLAIGLLLSILQIAASERVEVVVLHSTDEMGETVKTRVWIVDHEELSYLRTDLDSGWFQRLEERPEIKLEREGALAEYTAVPNKQKTATINQLMNNKYTWGDDLIAMFMDRTWSIAVELQPRGGQE